MDNSGYNMAFRNAFPNEEFQDHYDTPNMGFSLLSTANDLNSFNPHGMAIDTPPMSGQSTAYNYNAMNVDNSFSGATSINPLQTLTRWSSGHQQAIGPAIRNHHAVPAAQIYQPPYMRVPQSQYFVRRPESFVPQPQYFIPEPLSTPPDHLSGQRDVPDVVNRVNLSSSEQGSGPSSEVSDQRGVPDVADRVNRSSSEQRSGPSSGTLARRRRRRESPTDLTSPVDGNDPGAAPEAPKVRKQCRPNSCDACRSAKSKCVPAEGGNCMRCIERGTHCQFSPKDGRTRSDKERALLRDAKRFRFLAAEYVTVLSLLRPSVRATKIGQIVWDGWDWKSSPTKILENVRLCTDANPDDGILQASDLLVRGVKLNMFDDVWHSRGTQLPTLKVAAVVMEKAGVWVLDFLHRAITEILSQPDVETCIEDYIRFITSDPTPLYNPEGIDAEAFLGHDDKLQRLTKLHRQSPEPNDWTVTEPELSSPGPIVLPRLASATLVQEQPGMGHVDPQQIFSQDPMLAQNFLDELAQPQPMQQNDVSLGYSDPPAQQLGSGNGDMNDLLSQSMTDQRLYDLLAENLAKDNSDPDTQPQLDGEAPTTPGLNPAGLAAEAVDPGLIGDSSIEMSTAFMNLDEQDQNMMFVDRWNQADFS